MISISQAIMDMVWDTAIHLDMVIHMVITIMGKDIMEGMVIQRKAIVITPKKIDSNSLCQLKKQSHSYYFLEVFSLKKQ